MCFNWKVLTQNTDFLSPIWELEADTETIRGDKVGAYVASNGVFVSWTQLNEHATGHSSLL